MLHRTIFMMLPFDHNASTGLDVNVRLRRWGPSVLQGRLAFDQLALSIVKGSLVSPWRAQSSKRRKYVTSLSVVASYFNITWNDESRAHTKSFYTNVWKRVCITINVENMREDKFAIHPFIHIKTKLRTKPFKDHGAHTLFTQNRNLPTRIWKQVKLLQNLHLFTSPKSLFTMSKVFCWSLADKCVQLQQIYNIVTCDCTCKSIHINSDCRKKEGHRLAAPLGHVDSPDWFTLEHSSQRRIPSPHLPVLIHPRRLFLLYDDRIIGVTVSDGWRQLVTSALRDVNRPVERVSIRELAYTSQPNCKRLGSTKGRVATGSVWREQTPTPCRFLDSNASIVLRLLNLVLCQCSIYR